jgi:hypothetical protein
MKPNEGLQGDGSAEQSLAVSFLVVTTTPTLETVIA